MHVNVSGTQIRCQHSFGQFYCCPLSAESDAGQRQDNMNAKRSNRQNAKGYRFFQDDEDSFELEDILQAMCWLEVRLSSAVYSSLSDISSNVRGASRYILT